MGAPHLPLASQVSYEDRHPQESQKKGSTNTSGKTGMQGMQGMSGMQGMQPQGGDTRGKDKQTLICSCPCPGSGASGGPQKP